MKTLTLKIPDRIDRELAAAARRQGRSKSALVRDAIGALLSRGASSGEISALELAGELVGCVEGPEQGMGSGLEM